MTLPLSRFAEEEFRIQHRHRDGSYADLEEVPTHHDSAQHDPERWWGKVRTFRCTKCEETVLIGPEEDAPLPERR
jgi:hypothetical protein